MLWYNRYIRPHDSGGAGCEPKYTTVALMQGGLVHAGLAAWYRSGWENGDYKIAPAIEAMEKLKAERIDELVDEESWDKCWVASETQMNEYHNYYGPGGTYPQYPEWRVLVDREGVPLIERTFEVELAYEDYLFTSRPDLIVVNSGYICPIEHKTSAASRVNRLFLRFELDGQGTSELWVLKCLFPSDDMGSLIVNCLVKGAAKDKPAFRTHSVTRSPHDLEKFRNDTVRTLKQIERDLIEYKGLTEDSGMHPYEAAQVVFNGNPPGNVCVDNFTCDYFGPCKGRGSDIGLYKSNYKPRSKESFE
jgi:hypothetical protein